MLLDFETYNDGLMMTMYHDLPEMDGERSKERL